MKTKKLLAVLLAAVMTVALMPSWALAADTGVADAAALEEAIANAPDGQETVITLESSLELTETIVIGENKQIKLDMNDQTITVSDNFTGRPFTINGALSVTGNGTIDTTNCQTAYGSFDNYGSLVIENGTYIGSVLAGGSVVKNRPESYCEIYDGFFNGTPTAVYNEGVTKIYGGTFDGRSCSACSSSSWGYTIQSHWNNKGASKPEFYFYNGTVIGVQGAFSTSAGYSEIHDGTFETVSCDKHPNATTAWYALYIAGESGEVESHVYGGTFTSASKYAVYIGNSNDGGEKQQAAAYIHGGTFTSGRSDYVIYEDVNLGRLDITGGMFYLNDNSVADVSKWMNEDYMQDESGAIVHNHAKDLVHVPDQQPTCTEPGNSEYWYCEVCDLYFQDADAKTEITKEDTVIQAAGHKLTKTEEKAATCTEKGNEEYWACEVCGKYFSDEACTQEINLADTVIAATGHSYENGKCTVCGALDPDYVPFKPEIIAGTNGTWQKGSKDGMSFTSNAEFADFLKVQVDGKDVDKANYEVKEGSTIVTLKASYLETLTEGQHSLSIVSQTGTATTTFTIQGASVTDPDGDANAPQTGDTTQKGDSTSPKTGDSSQPLLWMTLLLVAGGGLGAMVYSKKRSRK